jgi:tripartite ATP-independent transporter DctM subunit
MLGGVHIAFTLAMAGILGTYIAFDGNLYPIQMIIWDNTSGFTLAVLIYFILMGEILLAGNVSTRLYDGALLWTNRLPGSILQVNIIGSTIFAAVTGVSAACAATLGRIAYVEGSKRNIPIGLNLGSLAGGATLGILIPPSIILIIYGILAEQSIGQLFMAGVLPGLMMAIIFMVYIAIRCIINRKLISAEQIRYSWRDRFMALVRMMPIFSIIIVVLSTIYFGWATPNEAGGIGAFFSFLLCLAYRDLKWKELWEALARTARITSMIMFLIIGAKIVTYFIANIGIPQLFTNWIVASGFSKTTVLVLICIAYVFLGMFIDSFSIIILTLPIVFPVIVEMQFDPILFGIIVVLLIETGLITPPYGINLYILDGVAGGGQLEEIIKGSFPFFILLLFGIVILFLFPEIALWLPRTML